MANIEFNSFLQSIAKADLLETKNNTAKPKPFVKWVGGKRSIIKELLQRLPAKINNYYEPFVGGGALFYELFDKVKYSYLSDMNMDLVVAYNTVKNNPENILIELEKHQRNHCEEYFYSIRALQEMEDPVENSARFIYLLKTCFNGLYRVNKHGYFNSPIGSYKNPLIADKNNIFLVSDALQVADIRYGDFSKIKPKKGDFVYFDPPYHPIKDKSFVNYVQKGFTEKDQTRLRDFTLQLSKNGVNVMISNSNTDFISDIYKKDFKIETVKAPRVVNCKVDKRKPVYEVIITNY